jgi:hypothetical protein
MGTMLRVLLLLTVSGLAIADGPGRIVSHRIPKDVPLTADASASHWRKAEAVVAENGPRGEAVPGHRTEIRSVWSPKHVYFLFTCPYEELYLNENPSPITETNKLWERDVAEVFIGSDFENIHRYKEFQVSPKGEWVDLDIDRKNPLPEGGWKWNSGYQVKARIDEKNKVWYGEMKIPFAAIDTRPPKSGNEMRINLYRIQGPGPKRRFIAWQPTGGGSYHVPESFGRLVLGPVKSRSESQK